MGNLLHKGAKTTPKVREEIQKSSLPVTELARKYNLTRNTIYKWKSRDFILDAKSGAKVIRSVLTQREQDIICLARKKHGLSVYDLYDMFIKVMPNLNTSNIYRCLKRNNLNKSIQKNKMSRKKKEFKEYYLGYIHIDITEFHIKGSKCYLYVGIDRYSRFVNAEIYHEKTMDNAVLFLKNFIRIFPYQIKIVLTDNGLQFTYRSFNKNKQTTKIHPFKQLCNENKIEHRLTNFYSPQTNGMVERANRTIKEATIKIYFYETVDKLKEHLKYWLLYYNYEKRLKSLNRFCPHDILSREYHKDNTHFLYNPVNMLTNDYT